MRAIVLAGGEGKRLRPYTTVIPKPLVPVGNRAILEILIESLKRQGITDITLCVNHLAELIRAYFGNGGRWGVKISYSIEDKPLSTVSPIKLIRKLPRDFLVLNGDVLTDLDFRKLFSYHQKNRALLTVATHRRKTKIDYGVFEIDRKKKIAIGFREKPEYLFDVSMGVYVFNIKALDLVPYNEPYGFDNLVGDLITAGNTVRVYPYTGYWLDVGRPEDYEQANDDIGSMKI